MDNIEFYAVVVEYSEAIGGDLVHVSFSETQYDDDNVDIDSLLDDMSKYLSISILYEFPPYTPNFEWCDGNEFNGGGKMVSYNLSDTCFNLKLDNNISFNIKFSTDKPTLDNIKKFISNIMKK